MTWEMSSEVWRLRVPDGITSREKGFTPPSDSDLRAMAVARGWLSDTVPATIIVSTRPRAGWTLRKLARHLGSSYDEDVGVGQPFDVPGAAGARRLDGRCRMEEGVSPDGMEHMTVVLAAARKDLVVLTIRTPYDDPALGAVETIARSLTVLA